MTATYEFLVPWTCSFFKGSPALIGISLEHAYALKTRL